jgi:cation:H+ antiporter
MQVFALVVGVVLAGIGGDWFVRGCVGTALRLRVPVVVVATTLAAFATSSPELVIAFLAASEGRSEVAFGDASGSTLVNLGVVLALSLLAVPVIVRFREVRREIIATVSAIALLLVLSIDGTISRIDGALLLTLFMGWIFLSIRFARDSRLSEIEGMSESNPRRATFDLLAGLVMLIIAGRLVLVGAEWIGESLGLDDFVIGTVLVAIATSVPEFVTSVVAILRRHSGVAVGTLLGSNVFNMTFVVAIAAEVDPIEVRWADTAVPLAFGAAATLLAIPGAAHRLGRARGASLLATYGLSLTALFLFR